MSISIRKNPLKNNMSSLYLDIYFAGQKPKYEGLKMRVYTNPKTRQEKEYNRQVMLKAEEEKTTRMLQYQTGAFTMPSLKYRESFLVFYKSLIKERKSNSSSYGNWLATYNHLVTFCEGQDLKFSECDDHFLRCFKKYLLTTNLKNGNTKLTNNTAAIYYSKVVTAINEACNMRIMTDNPCKRVKLIPLQETSRTFLTVEEVQKLINTECRMPVLKNAFIFACLTGLRISDIRKLTWANVTYSTEESIWKLNFRQQKTKALLYIPIKQQAVDILGKRRGDNDLVFEGLAYTAWTNHILAEWVYRDAGINKHVTFHIGRHTWATMAISSEVDIYSVMDMLGHKNIATTQVYAKIVNLKRNKVVDLLPDFSL